MTVAGPIETESLGITLIHEHVFFRMDASFRLADDDPDGSMASKLVTPQWQWWLRAHPVNNRDNLVQERLEVAVTELGQYKAAGGTTLVDVTTIGLAPNPYLLRKAAEATGLQIVAATGYYVAASLPTSVLELSTDALADQMRKDLLIGIDGSGVRAGIIGELGISNPPAPIELRVLAAAATVQRQLGGPVSIHPSWGADGARLTASLAEEAGLNPERTIISHLDNRFRDDVAGYCDLARRGFRLGLDCFGKECYYPHVDAQLPQDADRIRAIQGLLHAGFDRQIFLSQDICTKHQLAQYGGQGYAYVLQSIRSRLSRNGIDDATIQGMLVANPRQFLAWS